MEHFTHGRERRNQKERAIVFTTRQEDLLRCLARRSNVSLQEAARTLGWHYSTARDCWHAICRKLGKSAWHTADGRGLILWYAALYRTKKS